MRSALREEPDIFETTAVRSTTPLNTMLRNVEAYKLATLTCPANLTVPLFCAVIWELVMERDDSETISSESLAEVSFTVLRIMSTFDAPSRTNSGGPDKITVNVHEINVATPPIEQKTRALLPKTAAEFPANVHEVNVAVPPVMRITPPAVVVPSQAVAKAEFPSNVHEVTVAVPPVMRITPPVRAAPMVIL